jgi:MarR-like DNA-binding transcriptional regulator SgrR of sgrS sRNA
VTNFTRLFVGLLALATIFAIKPYYGGEITIRLNEPEDFAYAPSSYSNLIFYSLIYENLFYLKENGDIQTHIFQEYRYDKQTRTLDLRLKDNVAFSNGSPVTPQNIKVSLTLFLDMNLTSSRKLRRMIKRILVPRGENLVRLELLYDEPNVVASLTTPELVLSAGSDQVFSGMFYPVEWVKNQYIILKPNPYYPGGRSYLDSIKVVFYDYHYPDVFLSEPGLEDGQFNELNAGVYQNIYLTFPEGKVSDNTRIALYSLLKDFYTSHESNAKLTGLNALTSNEESPVTLNIKTFSHRRMRSILRYSSINLYILSSLKQMEEAFNEFLEKKGTPVETVYISDSQLINFMNSTSIKYLLTAKTFNRRMPIEEKIKIVLKEMSFARFNETYLKLLNQLDELKYLQNEELSLDLVSGIIEKIINDGFILPICQRRYSIYVKNHIKGMELDYYGKPIFRATRIR